MRDTFVQTLVDLVPSHPEILLITGDLGFGVLTQANPNQPKFAETYPKNYLNAGVAEQNMTLLATGLALEGRVVFTYSIANFPIFRCYEMIRNDACYHDANVKVVSIGGGFSYGSLGISHHATEDIAALRALPNITVVVPSDLHEVQEATKAITKQPGTCYLRLDKDTAPDSPDAEPFQLGKARKLREGKDVTIISAGGIMKEVLLAAQDLASQGVEARILSLHTIKPIDTESILRAAQETRAIITVEEHTVDGGLGSAVAEVLLDHNATPKSFKRVGLRAGFSSIVGSQEYLRAQYGLDRPAIVNSALQALKQANS